MAAMFATVNRNKKSVCLDLKVYEERAIFLDLVRTADASSRTTVPVSSIAGARLRSPVLDPARTRLCLDWYGTGPYENRRKCSTCPFRPPQARLQHRVVTIRRTSA